jgi:hypothetical protein
MPSNPRLHHQRRLELTDSYAHQSWDLALEQSPSHSRAFLLIWKLELKLLQQRAQQLVDVGRRDRLADALATSQAEMHQVFCTLGRCGVFPARRVEGVMVGSPCGGIVVPGMVADCNAGLELIVC